MIKKIEDAIGSNVHRADDAERAVIGSALLSETALDEVLGVVQPSDFFDPRYSTLLRAMAEMRSDSHKIDPTTLAQWLHERGKLAAAGGVSCIAEAFQAVPNAFHAVFYAKHVANASMLRAALVAAEGIARDAYTNGHEPEAVIDRAQSSLSSLLDRAVKTDARQVGDILRDALLAIEARATGGDLSPPVTTGLNAIDEGLAGGLRCGQLVILAARPGVGKSALALQIAAGAAETRQVLLVSLEMSSLELADRMLCQKASVDGHRMRNGTISSDDRRALVEAASSLANLSLHVDDKPGMTVRDVARAARQVLRKQKDIGLVVVDYLQLLTANNERESREQQVSAMSRGLKLLAKELKCPVLALCQMSRDVEKQGREPRLSDLRESGAIEQDADVVAFLHRTDTGGDKDIVKLLIKKQRSGPAGEVTLEWQKRYTRFVQQQAERFVSFDRFNGDADADMQATGESYDPLA